MKNSNAFILLLISIGLFYTFIMPEYAKVSALRSQANDYSTTLAGISALTASRDSLLAKYNSLPVDEVSKLSETLPDHEDNVTLALDLDTIAARNGITLTSIAPQSSDDSSTPDPNAPATGLPVATGPAYGTTDVQVTFVASYANFRLFLADLERSMRLVDVRSISFLATDTDLSQFSLDLRTYWLK